MGTKKLLEFVERLPERETGRWSGRWDRIRAELRARPSEWALLEEDVPRARRMTVRKALKKEDGFEVESFHVGAIDDGPPLVDIYARHIGKGA